MKKVLLRVLAVLIVLSAGGMTAFAAAPGYGRNFAGRNDGRMCNNINSTCICAGVNWKSAFHTCGTIYENCTIGNEIALVDKNTDIDGCCGRFVDADGDGICDNCMFGQGENVQENGFQGEYEGNTVNGVSDYCAIGYGERCGHGFQGGCGNGFRRRCGR